MNQALPVSARFLLCLANCTASWLCISALLISPALAQVNGPGPSDSALFDTVLNLPPDPDIISQTAIGGDGSTTQINVFDGGNIGTSFDANSGSEVNISGGTVGGSNQLAASIFNAFANSEVNISGGNILSQLVAHSGSVVNINGGTLASNSFAVDGSTVNISGGVIGFNFIAVGEVNISGGTIGASFVAHSGSVLNISGGIFGDSFDANPGSVLNISGGTFGNFTSVFDGSEFNLIGSDFRLDGVPVAGLVLGQALEVTSRDVTLSGILTDGTAFSFDLNSVQNVPVQGVLFLSEFFDEDATITVSLGDPFLLGDINQDDVVNFSDIPEFIELLIAGEFQAEADCNQDGAVNFSDIPAFIDILLNR